MSYDEVKRLVMAKVLAFRCPVCQQLLVADTSMKTIGTTCREHGTFVYYPTGLVDAKTGAETPDTWVFYYRRKLAGVRMDNGQPARHRWPPVR